MTGVREIADGVHWIYGTHSVGEDRAIHSSLYLVEVDGHFLLINSGDFDLREAFRSEIEDITGDAGVAAIFTQESHVPNSANVSSFRQQYDADVIFPGGAAPIHGFPDVIQWPQYGEETWHGRRFGLTRGPLLDLPHTTWIYDTESGVFFTCEGFCAYHDPTESECLSDELTNGIQYHDVKAFYDEMLLWLEYADPAKLLGELHEVLGQYDPTLIAPSHGHPIVHADIPQYVELVERAVQEVADSYEYKTVTG